MKIENLDSLIEKLEREKRIEAVAQLRTPIKEILLRLKDGLGRGEYKLLIGDDASGRIPTLIFKKAIEKIYERDGHQSPKTIFFAGSGQGKSPEALHREGVAAKSEKMVEYLNHIGVPNHPNESWKALLITDTISTGNSIRPVARVLSSLGIGFEIASIGIEPDFGEPMEEAEVRISRALGKRPIFGFRGAPQIYGEGSLSGVIKESKNLFSTPRQEGENEGGLFHTHKEIRDAVGVARENIDLVGTEVAQEYLAGTESQP